MKSIRNLLGALAAFAASSSSFAVGCLPNDPDPTCVNLVPEPGSLALVAIAIAGVVLVARKKK